MTFKEITNLIKLVNKSSLSEFKMKDGDFEISIRTTAYSKPGKGEKVIMATAPTVVPSPVMQDDPQTKAIEKPAQEEKEQNVYYLEIKSPIVGTFYRSPSPDKPPYVKVGDTVAVGDTVCIVEAMKLFNEIESEISGKIVKVMVEDSAPVEYDQVLFLVDPS